MFKTTAELEITSLNKAHHAVKEKFNETVSIKGAGKTDMNVVSFIKQLKKAKKKTNLYVLDFKGDTHASQCVGLEKEVSAIVANGQRGEEVIIKLESPGGAVNAYGLATAQIERLKDAGFKVTVAVDRVAASGGYMMACVADKIIASPFAAVGSIGVVCEMPNLNGLLKRFNVDYVTLTAGEHKRTLTLLGENTDEGKEHYQKVLEKTHVLFKDHVKDYRNVDIKKVATGDVWWAKEALKLDLVDEIKTSSQYIDERMDSHKIYAIKYETPKTMMGFIGKAAKVTTHAVLDTMIESLSRTHQKLY